MTGLLQTLSALVKQYPFITPLLGSFGTIIVFLIRPIAARIRREKQFSYRVLDDEIFIGGKTEVVIPDIGADRPGICDGDRQVVVQVVNDGQQPLKDEDFVRAVSITFGPAAEFVWGPRVLDSAPEDIGLEVNAKEGSIILQPLLFNQRDWATIAAVVRGGKRLKLTGRIVGVERIRRYRRDDIVYALQIALIFLVSFVAITLTFFKPDIPITLGWPLVVAQLIAMLLMILYPSSAKRHRINRYRYFGYGSRSLRRVFRILAYGSSEDWRRREREGPDLYRQQQQWLKQHHREDAFLNSGSTDTLSGSTPPPTT